MSVLSPLMMQIAMVVLAIFSAGGVLVAVLYPRLAGGDKTSKRLETVTARKARSSDRLAVVDDGRRKKGVEETLKELDEAQKAKLKKSQRLTLTTRLNQAGLKWNKRTYYLLNVLAMFLTFGFVMIGTGVGLIPAIGFAVAGGILLPHFFVNLARARRFKMFTAEFPTAVDVIVRGIKAGLPVVDCLRIIASEAQEPVRSEFQQIVEDQTLGMPLADAVSRLPERVPLTEANFFAIVIAIQSKTGGSLSESLANLSRVLRERKKLSSKIKSMSQEAKSSASIIGALPIIVAILVYFTSPDYIMLLFQTTTGNITLGVCALWMFMGIMVMRKMINFDY